MPPMRAAWLQLEACGNTRSVGYMCSHACVVKTLQRLQSRRSRNTAAAADMSFKAHLSAACEAAHAPGEEAGRHLLQ